MVETRAPAAPEPPAVLRPLFKQFGRPTGWLGNLAGFFMARNAYDDRWVVELLDVQPDDRVLEIGYGPGLAIGLLAERVRSGLVAGVDPSEVMLHQTTRRNAAAVRAGQVDLRVGSVERLPFADSSFDNACALHSVYFWPLLDAGLSEIRRVLRPGGRLALAVRMRDERGGPFNPSRYGLTDAEVADIVNALGAHRFGDITTHSRDFRREIVTVILATAWPE